MKTTRKLPVGIEDFQEIRTKGFYYVDKTGFIKELLNNWGKVNLFTRPRRFGRSLNMNMLQYFFSYGCDPALFDGLQIAGEKELCEKYMGNFPVISVTLKGVEGRNYEGALSSLCMLIGREALRFTFLLESSRLSEAEKTPYVRLTELAAGCRRESLLLSEALVKESLLILSRLLCRHYGQKVILLIDEYDVPLDKAQQYGYYDEMICLLRHEPEAPPRAFWVNTSGNAILRTLLLNASPQTRRELEHLVNGETVSKKIDQELTYRELYDRTDSIWSVLFTTGYLTKRGPADGERYRLSIPNREIRQIFIEQILQWFQAEVKKDAPALDAFCRAFQNGDAEAIERQFTSYLKKTISIRDTGARKGRKEHFYHGILLGLLSHREDWIIESNAESGEGFCDILAEIEEDDTGIVIEVKYTDGEDLAAVCREALAQIEKRNYADRLLQNGMTTIRKYGIACRKKRCRVLSA